MAEERGDDVARREAIGRIRARRGLGVHAFVFLAVNAMLVVVWAVTGSGYYWPVWAHLGWGIGLLAHAAAVLADRRGITEEQIQRELARR